MKISMPMLLFWVAIVLVPIVVSIAAIGIVPNDQSIPMRWDEPGLVHGGSPTKIMIIAMVLATANTFLAAGYLFNNNLDLPDLIHGADKRNYLHCRRSCMRFICHHCCCFMVASAHSNHLLTHTAQFYGFNHYSRNNLLSCFQFHIPRFG